VYPLGWYTGVPDRENTVTVSIRLVTVATGNVLGEVHPAAIARARPQTARKDRIKGSLRVGRKQVNPWIFLDFGPFGALGSAVLRSLIEGLAARPEVTEALAALATTLIRNAQELGSTSDLGSFGAAVLEFDGGPLVIGILSDGAALVLLARNDEDLGELLYLVRRHRAAMSSLL
jgi:predicted regulator of Ras-like GTPase activity (Roadblock/LC7/MglB family)